MTSPNNQSTAKTNRKHIAATIFRIVAWVIMAVVLFVAGILMGVVNILTPDRLTPLAERMATDALQNAEVKIGNVELTVMKSFPFVHADIEDLVILSTITSTLDDEEKEMLPQYVDTVLTVKGFRGGLNVMKLFAYQLDLSDVIIDHPAANLVVIDEETTNFDIIPAKDVDNEPFNWNDIPGISLKRFAIINPGKIRFYNVDTGTEIGASFTQVELDGNEAPAYTLNFDGTIEPPSEFLEVFNIPDLRFGLNGSMNWNQKNPTHLTLTDFDFLFSIFGGTINTELDFADGLKFNTLDIKMIPIDISQALSMIPREIAEEFSIPLPEAIDTDAKVEMSFALGDTWNLGSDTIPPLTLSARIPQCRFKGYNLHTDAFAVNLKASLISPWAIRSALPSFGVTLNIPETAVKWHDLDLKKFAADIEAVIPECDVNESKVKIDRLILEGPATQLSVKGTLTGIADDPMFDGTVDGTMDFNKLPAPVKNAIDGTLTGQMSTHISLRGAMSMLSPENFHRLNLKGDLSFSDLYWVSGDTVNMFDINRAGIKFGTTETVSRQGSVKADSLLRFSLSIDSALILHSDLDMTLTKFRINLAAQNTSERLNKGRINPMGGQLSLHTFNLLKTNDSMVVKLRDLKGRTVIKAYNNDISTPEFIFDLEVRRLSTGDKETRLVVNNAKTHFDARRVPKSASAKRFTRIADSIRRVHPQLSPDSVVKYALEIHNRHRSRYPRVHEKYVAADTLDILDWGASPLFKRMLTLWSFDGTLTSHRAGIFTPYLPVRNRLRDIDVSFNNDSININNLQYKIGHSDFTINGAVSNMRRAFTSTDGRQPLRLNFEMLSDTIDINQLTEALMAGSAYSATAEEKRRSFNLHDVDEEEESLEEHIARLTEDAPDTVMPILIPKNLDAEFSMRSNNVLYSDFKLRNMTGKLLTYEGALNMQNLSATSDVGSIDISALYTGLHPEDLRFGFGLKLNDFNLHKFLELVPAVDSLLPVMRDFSGIISADIAATSDVDRNMNLVLPTLDAAIGIMGDSLVLIDPDTFKSLSKWLLFKDKNRNCIDKMDVQMIVKDNQIDVYPFIFDIDRYKIGVQGYNDFDMNFDYHIAVLKSPIPFKFGINISGNPDKYKIRLGKARFGEQQIRQVSIVDTTRVNLMNEIHNVFRRGARNARLARLKVEHTPLAAEINLDTDTLTHADSLRYIQEGLIEGFDMTPAADKKPKNSGRKKRKKASQSSQNLMLWAVLAVRQRRRRPNQSDKSSPPCK